MCHLEFMRNSRTAKGSPYNLTFNSQFSTLNFAKLRFAKRDIGGTTLSRYTKLMLGHKPEITAKEK
jgi:hypothetical protein